MFLDGAGADLKFDLEPEPIFCVGSGSFFSQVVNEIIDVDPTDQQLSIKLNKFFLYRVNFFLRFF